MDEPRVVTFLTDYGLADPFVGMCRGVIARLAPRTPVLDLTHGVPRGDVPTGAVLLADCVPYLPPGVTLAVVDPGVGTARAAVAVRTGDPGGEHWFVGPDNGLLAPAVAALGGPREAWELAVAAGLPATFHGRDVFAPAAARLATGADPAALGRPIDPRALVAPALPRPRVAAGRLTAAVLVVDAFGNLSLAARPGDLAAAGLGPGARLTVSVTIAAGTAAAAGAGRAAGPGVPATVGRTFADVPAGEVVALVDSSGRVSVAVNGGSAAARLGAGRGAWLSLAGRSPG